MFKQIGKQSGAQSGDAQDAAHAAPGKQTLVELAGPAAVQRRASAPAHDEDAVHAAAAQGVATPGSPLPFGHSIQQLFGRHDISAVQAHSGPDAARSAQAMGAAAYATGNHVVLGGGANLHTVAHEAAHVVQQRAGVHLKGGVGEVGDSHEQHADAVADRVVRGESAEGLLDQYAGGSATRAPAVQRVWDDRRTVKGVKQQLWRQTDDDDDWRANGWYVEVDDDWELVERVTAAPEKPKVGEGSKTSRWDTTDKRKRKKGSSDESESGGGSTGKSKDREQEKRTKKTKRAKAPKLDPKITLASSSTVREAYALVTESEIGQSVLARALEASRSLEIVISNERTATNLDFGGDRRRGDTINLNRDRVTSGAGSVAQQLVMELANLSNKLRFWKVDYDAQNNKINEAQYIETNEHIEYDATKLVYDAWEASNGAWGKSNHAKFAEALASWETWWAHLKQHNPRHLEVYRVGWQTVRASSRRLPPPPQVAVTATPTITTEPRPTTSHDSSEPSGLALLSGYSSDPEPDKDKDKDKEKEKEKETEQDPEET